MVRQRGFFVTVLAAAVAGNTGAAVAQSSSGPASAWEEVAVTGSRTQTNSNEPQQLVKRVEVVTGGACATCASDTVAGNRE